MSVIKIIKNVKICGRGDSESFDILLAGNKIAKIGKQIDMGADCAEELDGKGMTAMPGYVDRSSFDRYYCFNLMSSISHLQVIFP